MMIRRFETQGREIPPWIERLAWLYGQYGTADFHQRFSLVPRRCTGKYSPAAREIRADSWAPSIRVARTRKRLPGPPPPRNRSSMLRSAYPPGGTRWRTRAQPEQTESAVTAPRRRPLKKSGVRAALGTPQGSKRQASRVHTGAFEGGVHIYVRLEAVRRALAGFLMTTNFAKPGNKNAAILLQFLVTHRCQ